MTAALVLVVEVDLDVAPPVQVAVGSDREEPLCVPSLLVDGR